VGTLTEGEDVRASGDVDDTVATGGKALKSTRDDTQAGLPSSAKEPETPTLEPPPPAKESRSNVQPAVIIGGRGGKTRERGGERRAPPVTVGMLTPLWAGAPASRGELVFVRRVLIDGRAYHQGFLCDWTNLRRALLAQIDDLFDHADLAPLIGDDALYAARGNQLASVPVSLRATLASPLVSVGMSPARLTLMLAWLAVLVGLGAVAVTLRSIIAFGQRRSRFASAVTHELRTPLTTFRMYTEMLTDGMVSDEDKKHAYLKTLKEESGRLAALVENVLAYARLEEGRRPTRMENVGLGDLLARVTPPLERRAAETEMSLRIERDTPPDLRLRTDFEAVGQILLNLVDNACKYAVDGSDQAIDVSINVEGSSLRIAVRDHGSGVDASHATSIFTPFERGDNHSSDKPGIGLGLALSRGLARDLGGDLTLDANCKTGACFELVLPLDN
jgi:signal transduction histidine kinase